MNWQAIKEFLKPKKWKNATTLISITLLTFEIVISLELLHVSDPIRAAVAILSRVLFLVPHYLLYDILGLGLRNLNRYVYSVVLMFSSGIYIYLLICYLDWSWTEYKKGNRESLYVLIFLTFLYFLILVALSAGY